MLDVSPSSLIFRDVRLKQAYTTSLCLTNSLSANLEFTLRTSSPRYSVSPSTIKLNSNQSCVVTVRLYLSSFPNSIRGTTGQDDYIHIKSSYFDQKIKTTFYLNNTSGLGPAPTPMNNNNNINTPITTTSSSSYSSSKKQKTLIDDLNSQLKAKEDKIKIMESTIGELESKHPSIQHVIQNRVEQERFAYEEKSAKVLQILHRKDDTITELQKQIQQADEVMKNSNISNNNNNYENNIKSKMFNNSSMAEDRIIELEQALEAERKAHLDSVNKLESLLKEERSAHQESIRKLEKSRLHSTSTGPNNELHGLRETRADQAEQIEVLVSEVSRLQKEIDQDGSLSIALDESQREVTKLKREELALREKISILESSNNDMERLLKISRDADNEREKDRLNNSIMNQHPDQHATVVGELTQSIREKTSALSIMQERVIRSEERSNELSKQIEDEKERSSRLEDRVQELSTRVSGSDRDVTKQAERIERIRNERDILQKKLEENETKLSQALDNVNTNDNKSINNDANLWWSYVWHELKRDGNSTGLINNYNNNSSSSSSSSDLMIIGSSHSASDGDLIAQVQRQREQLRQSAIELATCRQELLGRKLNSRRDHDVLRSQLHEAQRELSRINAHSRAHKSDGEIKIAELQATIRILSSRSDEHGRIAAVRQELESEKLCSHHLRADLDSYRDMLESEQNKVSSLRKDIDVLQGTLDAMAVLKTVLDIPGVDPAVLIETFSGKIVAYQADAARARADTAQAQSAANAAIVEAQRISLHGSPGDIKNITSDNNSNNNNLDSKNISPKKLRNNNNNSSSNSNIKSISHSLSYNMNTSNNAGNLSLLVDSETSPQKLLEALDARVLAQRIVAQESTINELRNRCAELEGDCVRAENIRLQDKDAFEENLKSELGSAIRKKEMSEARADMSRTEMNELRLKCAALEKKVVELQSDAGMERLRLEIQKSSSTMYSNNMIDNNDIDDNDHTNNDDDFEDLRNLRESLRDKSAQLRVATETLESLNIAGVNASTTINNNNNDDFIGGLSDLAAAPLQMGIQTGGYTTTTGTHGIQGLIKRVVELSSELSNQITSSSLISSRADKLETELRKKSKMVNRLRVVLRKQEEATEVTKMQVTTLAEQLRDTEKQRIDDLNERQRECDELAYALKEKESIEMSLTVMVEELNKEAAVSRQTDFQQWIENVVLGDNTDTNAYNTYSSDVMEEFKAIGASYDNITGHGSTSNYNNNSNNYDNLESMIAEKEESMSKYIESKEPIRDLVRTLVTQWQEQVGYSRGLSAATNGSSSFQLSKAEQSFLQKIVDLVTAAHERCNKAFTDIRWAEIHRAKQEMSHRLLSDRLRSCVQHLHIYRKRALAAEQILGNDTKHQLRGQNKLNTLLRSGIEEIRNKLYDVSEKLIAERRERLLVELKSKAALNQQRRLESRVAELESKGDEGLIAREDALHDIDQRSKKLESDMIKWFKFELPRLVTGYGTTITNIDVDVDTKSQPDGGSATINVDNNHMSNDRTYALAQALSVAKATQGSLELRVSMLNEKNSIMQEKLNELNNALQNWCTSVTFNEKDERVQRNDMQTKLEAVYSASSKDSAAEERVRHLSDKILTLQEENLDLKGRVAHSDERGEELRTLVDSVMKEEQALKTKATQQITKVRLEMETRHAEELRELREAYETEKNALSEELERLATAYQEASSQAQAANEQAINMASTMLTPGKEVNDNDDDDDKENHPHKVTAESQVLVDQSHIHVLEAKIKTLERSIEVERGRCNEAQNEAKELEQLMTVQRETLEKKVADAIASNNSVASSPGSTPIKAPGLVAPSPPTGSQSPTGSDDSQSITAVEQEISQEDSSLWPTVGTLLDELLRIIRGIPQRHKSLSKDASIRTALSMAVRIKAICIATPPNSSSSLNLAKDSSSSSSSLPALKQSVETSVEDTTLSPDDGKVKAQLRDLVSRVKILEDDLSVSIPEHQMYVLRDLRIKVLELEGNMMKWASEKASLETQLAAAEGEADELRASSDEGLKSIKSRYEGDLRSTQQALEEQNNAANTQIDRLQELLTRAQEKNGQLSAQIDEAHHGMRKMEDTVKQSRPLDEVLSMQRVVDRASDELEASKSKLRSMEEKHALEMRALQEQFNGYKTAQDTNVKSLEKQLSDMRSNYGNSYSSAMMMMSTSGEGGMTPSGISSQTISDEENADRIRRLEYRFRSKCSELDAALKALNRSQPGSVVDSSTVVSNAVDRSLYTADDSSESTAAPTVNAPPPPGVDIGIPKDNITGTTQGHVSISIAEELATARLQAAEREVLSLQDMLTIEKRLSAELRSENDKLKRDMENLEDQAGADDDDEEKEKEGTFIPLSQSRSTRTSGTTGNEGASDNQNRALSRRLNEVRKTAKAEISRLKSQITIMTSQLEATSSAKDELQKLRLVHEEMKDQLQSVRDDNYRKAKLLSNMKASKATDTNAVEQWRNEVTELEDKMKRLNRANSSKDAIIKDLRARLEEESMSAETAEERHTATLTANELRQRLRTADLERARSRARVSALKDKIGELEAELVTIREEAERLRRNGDRVDSARATLVRKDNLLKSQKASLDKLKNDLSNLHQSSEDSSKESERRIRNLQRQLAEAEQRRIEAERECELMRRRLAGTSAGIGGRASATSIRLGEYPDANSGPGVGLYSSSGPSNPVRRYVEHSETIPVSQPHAAAQPMEYTANTTTNRATTSDVDNNFPATLGLRSDDLDDVMAAIGSVNTGLSTMRPAQVSSSQSQSQRQSAVMSSSDTHSLGSASGSASGVGSTSDNSELSIEDRLKKLAKAALESPNLRR